MHDTQLLAAWSFIQPTPLSAVNIITTAAAAATPHRMFVCCRTVPQAQQLSGVTDIQLALNLSLRHEVLVEKCCGRRICGHCGKNYNIADIYLPADGDRWVVGLCWWLVKGGSGMSSLCFQAACA